MRRNPLDDPARLDALHATGLLDSAAEEAFDRFTCLAATILDAPVALVSLVDADRQFFKSCVGLPEPWASARQTPLSHSFCQHAVTSRDLLVVEDARQHLLVKDNLAVHNLEVVAHLGVPLITSDGHALGSFCVIDSQPRRWSDREVGILRDLAAAVMSEIELRAQTRAARREASDRQLAERRLRVEHAVSRTLSETADLKDVLVSDVGMPGQDGYALIRRVRALGPDHGGNVPAVALTAYARSEDRTRSILAGFQMRVVKPIEPPELN